MDGIYQASDEDFNFFKKQVRELNAERYSWYINKHL